MAAPCSLYFLQTVRSAPALVWLLGPILGAAVPRHYRYLAWHGLGLVLGRSGCQRHCGYLFGTGRPWGAGARGYNSSVDCVLVLKSAHLPCYYSVSGAYLNLLLHQHFGTRAN